MRFSCSALVGDFDALSRRDVEDGILLCYVGFMLSFCVVGIVLMCF